MSAFVPARNPWIETLPVQWREAHLRRYVRLSTGGTPDKSIAEYWENGTVPWLASGEINKRRIHSADAYITDVGLRHSSARWLPAGSVLMALAGQGKTKATVATLEFPATCNQSLAVMVPDESTLHYRYLFRYLASQYQNIRGLVGDQRDGLSLTHISGIWLPLPDLLTQKAIADFLDRKTAAIDALIEKKQKLLTLLAEKRATLINQAVTKGLDPDVPMKDSGIPWIGEIPAHWGVTRVGNLATVVRGGSPRPAGDPTFFNGNALPWITVGEVTNASGMFIRSTATMLTEEGVKASRTVDAGTLLLSNSGATLGVPRFTAIRGCINDGSVAFQDINPLLFDGFLYWCFADSTERLRNELQQGMGQPNLNTDMVRSERIPFPPWDEQISIAKRIMSGLVAIEATESRLAISIQRLQEYRQALITAAVTGRLDIGEVA